MDKFSAAQHDLPGETLSLLAISGSLRAASSSTAVLRALSHERHPGVALSVKTLEDIPLYNQDLDTGSALTPIAMLRDQIRSSDGVVIATPEYNHGIPGVLKNALDWASRPAFASCFRGKPVLIITCAPGATGGVRAQYQLRETLVSMLAHVVPTREILLARVQDQIVDGKFNDADTVRVLVRGIHALREEIILRQLQEAAA